MTLSLKKGDEVQILSGKEKNKKGKILKVFAGRERAIVEKVNFVKKHQRPTQEMQQGGVIEKEASLHVSNLQLICPRCHKQTKIKIKRIDTHRMRSCKKCGEMIDKD